MKFEWMTLLNMSLAACPIILTIVILRLIFRKTSRKVFCVLWVAAALRLILPVSAALTYGGTPLFSVTESIHQGPEQEMQEKAGNSAIPQEAAANGTVAAPFPESPSQKPVSSVTLNLPNGTAKKLFKSPGMNTLQILMIIWSTGTASLLLAAAISYLQTRNALLEAIPFEKNILIHNGFPPFVFGLRNPRIILPEEPLNEQMNWILLHERAHIRRGDQWWKLLGFLILALHWINPLVWLGYMLFARDIEMACDEDATDVMIFSERQEYCRILLSYARKKKTTFPVAFFGKGGIKNRMKKILTEKKSSRWMGVFSVLLVLTGTVFAFTSCAKKGSEVFESSLDISQNIEVTVPTEESSLELTTTKESESEIPAETTAAAETTEPVEIIEDTSSAEARDRFGNTGIYDSCIAYIRSEDPEYTEGISLIELPLYTVPTESVYELGIIYPARAITVIKKVHVGIYDETDSLTENEWLMVTVGEQQMTGYVNPAGVGNRNEVQLDACEPWQVKSQAAYYLDIGCTEEETAGEYGVGPLWVTEIDEMRGIWKLEGSSGMQVYINDPDVLEMCPKLGRPRNSRAG